jgi:hypothetical protein
MSNPGKIFRELLLKLREIVRDALNVETGKYRLFRLVIEKEPKGRLDTRLWRISFPTQSLVGIAL